MKIRQSLQAKLREEALGGGGKVSLAALFETLVPVQKMRDLAREHGLSPKGGFRLEKAPAKVLVPLLVEPDAPKVFEEVCEVLAECMTRDLQAAGAPPADGQVKEPQREGPAHAFGPMLKLKEQELKDARADLEKSRKVAQGLREKVDELNRQIVLDQGRITQLTKEIESLRETAERLSEEAPAIDRDQAAKIQSLEKELEEQNQIELQQRRQLAERQAAIRERDERILELEALLPPGRRRKKRAQPPPPPENFVVPHFTITFLKSLAGKDRRAIEHAYRAVFLFCTEGPQYPGLQVKPLDPSNVWSLRASLKLRVYFRRRPDGDVEILELLDRQEQETMLRRYRDKP